MVVIPNERNDTFSVYCTDREHSLLVTESGGKLVSDPEFLLRDVFSKKGSQSDFDDFDFFSNIFPCKCGKLRQ